MATYGECSILKSPSCIANISAGKAAKGAGKAAKGAGKAAKGAGKAAEGAGKAANYDSSSHFLNAFGG